MFMSKVVCCLQKFTASLPATIPALSTANNRLLSTKCEKKGEKKEHKTPLYDFHVENCGKIVNFGGYLLPVQYGDQGIADSHHHTRKSASLFDVSHMLQTEIIGSDSVKLMESICTADIEGMKDNTSTLTVFTNEKGGILDDLIVTKINCEHLYVVSNAAMRSQDEQIIRKALDTLMSKDECTDVSLKFFDPYERALLALQGPFAADVLQYYLSDDLNLDQLYFMESREAVVCGTGACRVTRCGYTGEDGFEISVPAIKAVDVATELVNNECVKLAGLGARDSLRLEAGLCLYGSDISPETTPVEASLAWLVAKKRREQANFPGAAQILAQLKKGAGDGKGSPRVKRVGLLIEKGGPPARHGANLMCGSDRVGQVTSGSPAPTLDRNIAMGYLPLDLAEVGTKLGVEVRDKVYECEVVKMPFVPTKYYSKSKK